MDITPTTLPGVLALQPRCFEDDRGFFLETWNQKTLLKSGLDLEFMQDNHSLSRRAGTIRGLHFQAPPHAQDKLVRVIKGSVLDVAVDIRKGSPNYGEWVGEILSGDNMVQLLIPKGFLHGFVTLEPDTEVLYKCTDVYAPDCDGGVHFADPTLAIDWGIAPEMAILSGKDAKAQSFADFDSPFTYEPPQ